MITVGTTPAQSIFLKKLYTHISEENEIAFIYAVWSPNTNSHEKQSNFLLLGFDEVGRATSFYDDDLLELAKKMDFPKDFVCSLDNQREAHMYFVEATSIFQPNLSKNKQQDEITLALFKAKTSMKVLGW